MILVVPGSTGPGTPDHQEDTLTGMTATNPTAHETLRKADLIQLAQLIESQRVRTVDLAAPGRNLWFANGNLIVQGVEPHAEILANGVELIDVNGVYALGDIGVESLAARIAEPRPGAPYLKALRADHTDLFDVVAGYHLRGELNGEPSPFAAPDSRLHTVRLLVADDSADNEVDGMVRAFLGGRYMAIDNVDILTAVMEGMDTAGVRPGTFNVEADLTESRMVIKVWVPDMFAYAPQVFGGYTSPFSGQDVATMPKVYAGLVASNSEVGRGAWSIAPRIVFQACKNGQTITRDAFTRKHVGEKLDDDGVIKWSKETVRAVLEVIKHKTADAVRTYLDADYVTAKLAEMAERAGAKLDADPETVITKVTRHTGHSGARSAILNMYLQGGQSTAGGVMQAYTAAAQVVASGDLAYDLENRATDALEWSASNLAARL